MSDNILRVRETICNSAVKSGRNPEDVLLIAVSKTYPAEDILKALQAGITDIGENKVQEMKEKIPQLPHNTRVHLIGHLQTNKVKAAVENACMIQSVDSVHLAKEISRCSVNMGKVTEVLLQVNIAQDEAKFGFAPEMVDEALGEISTMEGIKVKGFMTVPAIETDKEITRKYFRKMRSFFESFQGKKYSNVSMDCLSMGMSGDYDVAVEEGATMVRVGSLIFGARDYSK
ncbi:MAG: YggS family pyridoxal phosphate-dependent enzyme [Clostridia bacterium]|nr:YggS family pyridoxal phosphate-dependent enzyme [Clostridia bacterium]